MSRHHVLTSRCPSCQAVVQVKTRAEEKVLACPKCGTSMTVAAPQAPAPTPAAPASPAVARPAAAPLDNLPTAGLWQDQPARGRSSVITFLVAGCVAGVLLGAAAAFAFRPSPEKGKEVARKADDKAPGDVRTNTDAPGQAPAEAPAAVTKDEPGPPAVDPTVLVAAEVTPTKAPPVNAGGDAQAKLRRALARVQSLERQRRDWLLANAGREAARGNKVIVWPNERLLQQALQELELARREAGQER